MSWTDRLLQNLRLTPEEAQRYASKPLLLLLDNYVLDCIGELRVDPREMARVVQRVFKLDAVTDWRVMSRDVV